MDNVPERRHAELKMCVVGKKRFSRGCVGAADHKIVAADDLGRFFFELRQDRAGGIPFLPDERRGLGRSETWWDPGRLRTTQHEAANYEMILWGKASKHLLRALGPYFLNHPLPIQFFLPRGGERFVHVQTDEVAIRRGPGTRLITQQSKFHGQAGTMLV